MIRILFFISFLFFSILSFSQRMIFTSTSSTHSTWSSRKHEYIARHSKKKLIRFNFSLDTIYTDNSQHFKVLAPPLRIDMDNVKIISVHCIDKHKRDCTFSIYSYNNGHISVTVYYRHNIVSYDIDANIF